MNIPSHEAVAQRACELWQSHDCPAGRDTEFWLEAEKQLTDAEADSATAAEVGKSAVSPVHTTGLAKPVGPAAALGFPVEAVAPATAMPGGAGAKVMQKQMARAPQIPAKHAPKAVPPETGKPLWDKPHSS